VIRLQNIRAGRFDSADAAYLDLDYFQRELADHDVVGGDLLIAGLGDDNNQVGRACVAPDDLGPALVKADCFRFRLDKKKASTDFVALLLSIGAPADGGYYATGSTRQRIPLSVTGRRCIALPPLSEQIAIAAFLDRETAKIDALVADYRALIELLQEKRQAVISHAVTKGLDPTVPMKDSGVEWLGEVPEHWDIMRLKWISPEITVGIVVEPSKYYVQDRGVPALRSLNIRPGQIDPENMVLISEQANEELAKSRLIAGDLVAVRSGQPGTTAVVPKEISGCNCIDLIIIRRALPDLMGLSSFH
jgi:type I restriction enzyme S subunit